MGSIGESVVPLPFPRTIVTELRNTPNCKAIRMISGSWDQDF